MNYIKEKINIAWTWVKTNVKKTILFVTGTGVALAAGAAVIDNPEPITLEDPQVVSWVKPTTDAEWAEDTKKESLHLKYDTQLAEMKVSHEANLPAQQKDLDKITNYPDAVKWRLHEHLSQMFEDEGNPPRIEGKTLQQWIDVEFAEQVAQKTWGVEKLQQSIERIDKEIDLRKGYLSVIDKIPAGNPARKNIKADERSPLGTTYYIDADCATPGDGTTPTCNGDGDDSYDDLDDFTETSRTNGDKAILRRGTTARYDNGSDLNFTSDGFSTNPIFIQADYDDTWGDFASSTQTYTPIFGSKTMEASASISGISVGDWIFVQGDNEYDYSYEVSAVSGTTLTLYLPYKGGQSSSGNTLNVMPAAPVWNLVTGNFQVVFDNDDKWRIQGISFSGTDSLGVIRIDSAQVHYFKDVVISGNGSSDYGIYSWDDHTIYSLDKSRIYNVTYGIRDTFGTSIAIADITSSLIDNNNVSVSSGIYTSDAGRFSIKETEFKNSQNGNIQQANGSAQITGRNLVLSQTESEVRVPTADSASFAFSFLVEDKEGTIGDNFQFLKNGAQAISLNSTSTVTRAGGGDTSIYITPAATDQQSPNWEYSRLKLFEYPIYTDTTSRDYQVFFRSGDGTPFIASPTVDELWIECEYWGHASNNYRRLIKSTGTVDFTTDSDFDQSLTITCAPSQTGILYLRGWYAKTKEAGSNQFFIDVQPVISDT